MKKNIVLLVIMLFSSQAYAADCNAIDNYFEKKECIDANIDESDARLNIVYKKLISSLKAFDKENTAQNNKTNFTEQVLDSQRKWIAFRDSDCAAVASITGTGIISDVESSNCLLSHTVVRIKQLQAICDALKK